MLKVNKKTTILVLAPHTDDGEFGCGATISKFIDLGARVIYVAFSAAEQSVPEGLPKNILRQEVLNATKVLGIKDKDCIVLNFEVRKFPEFRQKILDEMIKINNKFNPDLVFLPSTNDTHQDHLTIANEGFRAFKKTSVFAYEVPWNNPKFHASTFISISKDNLLKKINSVAEYNSQKHRDYANSEYIQSLAVTRGVQVGFEFAEAFEIIRLFDG